MRIIVTNKLELVRTFREIAASQGCHLTLKAASKIADWLQNGLAHSQSITASSAVPVDWIEKAKDEPEGSCRF